MTNEAAERLREHLVRGIGRPLIHVPLLDAALAAERKATVERIRAAIEAEVDPDNWGPADWWEAKVVPILDKEAQT